MHRPSAEEFLQKVLESLEDLPPELIRRLAEAVKTPDPERTQAIRRVFEDIAGD
jgi:hypothetical protein